MEMRHDAAMAAAEIGMFIEKRCQNIPTLVGTVGHFEVPNGAANVVPGEAIFSIDIRAADDQVQYDTRKFVNKSLVCTNSGGGRKSKITAKFLYCHIIM
jgi:acetylornithine deacetylase/succinyl-diaminopimelate desuccinylase-like protein